MTPINAEIQGENLDHLGLIAGIIDELEIVETINELLGIQPGEIVSAGVVVKAIILNGLGMVSRPLYLFPQFFQDKAIETTLDEKTEIIAAETKRAGRLVLATNILESQQLSADEVLTAYREQQAPERGFAFLKDPLFFADSVFLKTAARIETLAMLMGLCLLVYKLGQRELRLQLKQNQTGVKNQLGKLTDRPTLRWIFQGFQGIHVVFINGVKQVSNLTNERRDTLSFFPEKCQQYYFSSA